MTEQTERTVEDVQREIAEKQTERRLLRTLNEQREKLLPRLEVKYQRICDDMERLREEADALGQAIGDINAGKPTDYRLRAKPKKAALKPAEPSD